MSLGQAVGNNAYGAIAADQTVKQVVAEKYSRSSVLIQNRGANEVFIGFDANLTTANGIEVPSGQSITVPGTAPVFCRCSGGETADIRFLEVG